MLAILLRLSNSFYWNKQDTFVIELTYDGDTFVNRPKRTYLLLVLLKLILFYKILTLLCIYFAEWPS